MMPFIRPFPPLYAPGPDRWHCLHVCVRVGGRLAAWLAGGTEEAALGPPSVSVVYRRTDPLVVHGGVSPLHGQVLDAGLVLGADLQLQGPRVAMPVPLGVGRG